MAQPLSLTRAVTGGPPVQRPEKAQSVSFTLAVVCHPAAALLTFMTKAVAEATTAPESPSPAPPCPPLLLPLAGSYIVLTQHHVLPLSAAVFCVTVSYIMQPVGRGTAVAAADQSLQCCGDLQQARRGD